MNGPANIAKIITIELQNEKKLRHADSIGHGEEKNEREFKLMRMQEENNMLDSVPDYDGDN